MRKVLLIVNPVAGKRKSRTAIFKILDVFCKAGYTITTQLTEYRGHATELATSAESSGHDLVVCFGGDGTLNEVITGLINSESKIPFGYIPAGSTNDYAKSRKLSHKPHKAAKAIVEGSPRPIDIGEFGSGHYFSYVASFGAFTATSYSVNQSLKNVFGHFAYLLGGIKEFAMIREYQVKTVSEEKINEEKYIFGVVINSTSMAGLVHLKESLVSYDDGLFEIGLVKKPKNAWDWVKLIHAVRTSDFSNGSVDFYKSSEIEFITPGKLDWSLDGEHMVSDKKVSVKNLKKRLLFIS